MPDDPGIFLQAGNHGEWQRPFAQKSSAGLAEHHGKGSFRQQYLGAITLRTYRNNLAHITTQCGMWAIDEMTCVHTCIWMNYTKERVAIPSMANFASVPLRFTMDSRTIR